MKKLFAVLLEIVAIGSCFYGVILASSEAVRKTSYDNFPSESQWEIWIFLFITPTILTFLAFRIWPEKNTTERLYRGSLKLTK